MTPSICTGQISIRHILFHLTCVQAVQSLDDKIIDLFGSQGQHHDNPEAATDQHRTPAQPSSSGNSHPNAHSLPGDGWVELRGGDSSSKATSSARGAFLEPLDTHRVSEGGWGFDARSPRGIAGSAAHSAHLAHSTAGYPGAFIMGKRRERGGRKARVFGTPLDDLLMNPDRCAVCNVVYSTLYGVTLVHWLEVCRCVQIRGS